MTDNLLLIEPISLAAILRLLPASLLLLFLPGLGLSFLLFGRGKLPWTLRLPMAVALSIGFSITAATLVLAARLPIAWLLGMIVGTELAIGGSLLWRRFVQRGPGARQGSVPATAADEPPPRPFRQMNPWLLAAFGVASVYALWRFCLPINRFVYSVDFWAYASFVRKWASWGPRPAIDVRLGTPTGSFRDIFGGWLLVQSLLSLLSGCDPIDISAWWLPPILMLTAYWGFYNLAEALFRRKEGAILAALVQMVALAVCVNGNDSLGHIFIARINEDKFLLAFVLLPFATIFMLRYLCSGQRGDYLSLLLFGVALPMVHPLGLAEAGLTFGPFALLHFALQRRRLHAARLALILLPLLCLLVIPLIQKQYVNKPYTVQGEEAEAEYNRLQRDRLWLLDRERNRYILHPGLLRSPVTIAALALTPLLVLFVKSEIGAQFLLANTLALLFLLYNPLLTPQLGRITTPWMLWRLIYLLPSSLTLGFLLEKAMRVAERYLTQRGAKWASLAGLLPVGLILAGAVVLHAEGKLRWPAPSAEPIYQAERDILLQARRFIREPSVVMCRTPLQQILAAFIQEGFVPNWEWKNPKEAEVWAFYEAGSMTPQAWATLQKYRCRYIIAEKELFSYLLLPYSFLTPLYANERYALLRVGEISADHPLLRGNGYVAEGKWEQAMAAYQEARATDPVVAGLQLATIQARQGDLEKVEDTLLELVHAGTNSPWPYLHLANLLRLKGEPVRAWQEYVQAANLARADPLFPSVLLRGLERAVTGGLSLLTCVPEAEAQRWGVVVNRRNGPIEAYDTDALRIGWYSDWWLTQPASRPGLLQAQVIHVGRDLYPPAWEKVEEAIARRPGALWLVGIWPEWEAGPQRTPQEYAEIYHEVYHFIKERDPIATVVPGGIMSSTPLRLRWLDAVLEAYYARYREKLPADAWHINAFILREQKGSWGAGIPYGIVAEAGQLYELPDHADAELFRQQVVAFRRWMAERGEQGKPLLISGYGIKMPSDYLADGDATAGDQRVIAYMRETFDYLRTARDESIGCPWDDYRLVQRWLWYSLNDMPYDWETGEGSNGMLFVRNQDGAPLLTIFGQAFATYMASVRP